jgi:hypothetical protein
LSDRIFIIREVDSRVAVPRPRVLSVETLLRKVSVLTDSGVNSLTDRSSLGLIWSITDPIRLRVVMLLRKKATVVTDNVVILSTGSFQFGMGRLDGRKYIEIIGRLWGWDKWGVG